MNLKVYLASIDMTVKDFAELIETAPNYVSRIARGHILPSKKLARRIEKFTDGVVKVKTKEMVQPVETQ